MNERLKKLIEINKKKIKEKKSIGELYGDLFEELVLELNEKVIILSEKESNEIRENIMLEIPFTNLGRIDWDKLNGQVIDELEEISKKDLDMSVFIVFDNVELPVLKVRFEDIVDRKESISCISFDKWIVAEDRSFFIEIYHEGEIRYCENF